MIIDSFSTPWVWFQFLIGRLSTLLLDNLLLKLQTRFNSLQVDYQLSLLESTLYIVALVSIPYRQTINLKEFQCKDGSQLVFQFLIGRLSTEKKKEERFIKSSRFNSLQVDYQLVFFLQNIPCFAEFQFLIGRLSTNLLCFPLWILPCFNSLQVDYQQVFLFRPLIFVICGFNSLQVDYQLYYNIHIQLYMDIVSIPYRQTINAIPLCLYSSRKFCFNSLQVDYQLCIDFFFIFIHSVSIPYRQTINLLYYGFLSYIHYVSIPYRQTINSSIRQS